jgi:hypothetical protein
MRSHTNKFLVAVVVLQGLMILGQWSSQGGTAHAKPDNLPDPGARQLQMIDELKAISTKLDRLNTTLERGDLQVKVKKEEK